MQAPTPPPGSDFAIAKFNEYHELASQIPGGTVINHKGACIFYTGLIFTQSSGICGDLKDIEEKAQILRDKETRFSIFCSADTTLKISGFLGISQHEAFWSPFRENPVTLDPGHAAIKVDAASFEKWNDFCTRTNKDKLYKSQRLTFFQQIIILQIPVNHWIYKINDVIVAALSTLILKDTLFILNPSSENNDAFKKLAQETINNEKGKELNHVITYLTPKEFQIFNGVSIWSYHVYLMF